MSVSYSVILQDDFDWNYVGKNKNDIFQNLKNDFVKLNRAEPELLAEWYGFMVIYFERTSVWLDEYKYIILEHCTSAYFYENTTPYDIKKL